MRTNVSKEVTLGRALPLTLWEAQEVHKHLREIGMSCVFPFVRSDRNGLIFDSLMRNMEIYHQKLTPRDIINQVFYQKPQQYFPSQAEVFIQEVLRSMMNNSQCFISCNDSSNMKRNRDDTFDDNRRDSKKPRY